MPLERFKDRFQSLGIRKKIGYGYGLAIGIGIVGYATGKSIENIYQRQTREQLAQSQEIIGTLSALQGAVLQAHTQTPKLISLLADPVRLELEYTRFLEYIAAVNRLLKESKFLLNNFNSDPEVRKKEMESLRRSLQAYVTSIKNYSQQLELIPREFLDSEKSQEPLPTAITSKSRQVDTKINRVAKELTLLVQEIQKQQAQQTLEALDTAQAIGNKITVASLLASAAIALILATYTSRAIARPLEATTQFAQKVTQEANFTLQAPVTTTDEVGLLAASFNQLIQRVAQYTEELIQAQQAADAANKAKSEFLANMSHELRTPLNAILGFAQVMNRDSSLNAEQQENLGIINRSGEHLLSLINDVLDLSKIEAGKTVLNENNFDLYIFLDSIQEILQLKAESKDLQFNIEIPPDLPQYVEADEKKLRQVLINLLNNAIKFTRVGGVSLRVSVVERKQQETDRETLRLYFEVEDTGPGIAPEELNTLFDPFIQTETGRKSQEGTGLGLPISRQFTRLMGGDITVSSILGEGAIFKFDIQVKLAKAVDIEIQQPKKRAIGLEPDQPEYRILVTDDRPENRKLLVKLLSPLGFLVQEAANGQECIQLWETWEPHLICMDMRMPVIDGYEATKRIKSHVKGQATVIIALTASAFEDERMIVLNAGCDDFMRKPFGPEVIFEKIAQYLGVRYLYEEGGENTQQQSVSASSFEEGAIAESLAKMPVEWVRSLYEAATQLDDELVVQLSEQIHESNPVLSKIIRDLVNDFKIDKITEIIERFNR